MMNDKAHNPSKQYVLGLDGGGTKTYAVLFDAEDEACSTPLKTALAGPSNLNSTSVSEVQSNFQQILHDLDIPVTSILATGIGVAGISGPGVKESIQEILADLGLDQLTVVGDQEAALRGALGHSPGILLIAGTGSIAMGQGPGGIARAGGFGHLIGDEGSGYALGKRFLAETLRTLDGQREASALTQAVVDLLDSDNPIAQIMDIFYATPFDKSRIARFAIVMDELLEAGDEETLAIVKEEARYLLLLVQALAKKIGSKGTYLKLILAGSLLKSKLYREVFLELLETLPETFLLSEALADAARGAAMLAREHLLES